MRAGIESVCRALVPILGREVTANNLEELTRDVVAVVSELPPSGEMEFNPLPTGGFRLAKRLNGTELRLVLLVEPHQFVIFGDLARPGIGHSTYGRLMTLCWKERSAAVSVDCDFSQEPFYGELVLSIADIFRAAPELRLPLTIDPSAVVVIRAIDAMIPVMSAT